MGVFKIIGALCFISAIVSGCGTVREIPVQTVEKVVVRDSLIYIKDTVEVEIPVEVEKEVLPDLDTSRLETSFAESIAYVDTAKRMITHTLRNKPQAVMKPIELPVKTKIVEKVKEVEVPVEVPVPTVPRWCWILLVTCGAYFSFLIAKLIYKHHHL